MQVGKGLELEGEYTLALLEILTRQRVSHLWTVSLRIKIRPEFFDPQHLVNCGDQILHGTSLEREIDRHSEDFCHRDLLKNPRRVLDISLGGEVRRGPSYPDPV